MAKPPAGSSLLFGALADSGRIKERQNGTYRMVLKGIDEIDWFTDRPDHFEGLWKPQKLIHKWDSYFATSDPNAQASFKVGEERELITFEMFKPKYNEAKKRLSYKIDPDIINKREGHLVDSIKGKALDEVTLFIDDAIVGSSRARGKSRSRIYMMDCATLNWSNQYMRGLDLEGLGLPGANMSLSEMTGISLATSDLTGANLSGAVLRRALLEKTNFTNADLSAADMTAADVAYADFTGAIWNQTICPDGTMNDGTLPCTAAQLNLA